MNAKSPWGKLFGMGNAAPRIPFGVADLPQKVRDIAAGKMSLSGVQMKASLALNRKTGELEITPSGGTYILKPSPAEFPGLAEIENLCMDMAALLEMDVPPHALVFMADGARAYIIKRFDRGAGGEKIHKEDMAQLLELPVTAKYDGSLERVGKAIRKYSSRPFLDLTDFFERVVFSFIIGNGDMHLKNWALVTRRVGESAETTLAPCYDFVSSRLYIPKEDESALTMGGRRNALARGDFEKLAEALQIDARAAARTIDRLAASESTLASAIDAAGLPEERRKAFRELLAARIQLLR